MRRRTRIALSGLVVFAALLTLLLAFVLFYYRPTLEWVRQRRSMILPISLIVTVLVVFLFGLLRLSSKATASCTLAPLLFWFCLFFGGIAIWTWVALIREAP